MAINIDTVYQKVLALANKEQRGYITPQEFNLFADQAQKEIFEQYFYDIDQYRRRPNNDHAYGDVLSNLEEKISHFKKHDINVSNRLDAEGDVYFGNSGIYRIGMVRVKDKAGKHHYIAEEMKMEEEFRLYKDSPLAKYTKKRPIYWKRRSSPNWPGGEGITIRIYPPPQVSSPYNAAVDGSVLMSYIQTPDKPIWGYVVVNDKSLYNAGASANFNLHPSEESELVYKILTLAGITLEKPQLTQIAAGIDMAKVQQEKQ